MMNRISIFSFTIKVILCAIIISTLPYCSSFTKSSPANIKKLLNLGSRNIYTAESIENISRKQTLLKDAFSAIAEADSLSKNIKKDTEGMKQLVAHHYALYYYAMKDFDTAQTYAQKALNGKKTLPVMKILSIRINLKLKDKKYVKNTINELRELMAKHSKTPMGHLVLGDCYYYLSDIKNALYHYKKVLFIGRQHQVLAANRIETLNKIRSVRVNVKKYQNLVIARTLKRYEIAHILYNIFKIHIYFQIKKNEKISFTDIASLKNSKPIIELSKKGMFTYVKNNSFKPFTTVTRGELAKIIEDFIVLASGNIDYRTMYSKSKKTPIKDVTPDNAFYNAMRIAIKKNIMNLSLSGYMNPKQPVNGLDTLLILKKMVVKGRR